jgi:hypothetical protein
MSTEHFIQMMELNHKRNSKAYLVNSFMYSLLTYQANNKLHG